MHLAWSATSRGSATDGEVGPAVTRLRMRLGSSNLSSPTLVVQGMNWVIILLALAGLIGLVGSVFVFMAYAQLDKLIELTMGGDDDDDDC